MVALLALCPIRRKNFAALEIGRSFVEIHGTWWIVLSASETKEKRADERPINELLKLVIDRYLGQHRPVLARSDNAPAALWLSAKNGAPITEKEVARVIRMTAVFDSKCTGEPASVSHLGGLDRRHPRRREPLSRERTSAPHGPARHQRALQPSNEFQRRRKFPANRSAVRENMIGIRSRR